jgi:hypothetical protein
MPEYQYHWFLFYPFPFSSIMLDAASSDLAATAESSTSILLSATDISRHRRNGIVGSKHASSFKR